MRFLTAIAALVGVALCSGAHGATAVGRAAASNPIPILMYHVIGDPPNGAPFPELYVDEKTFQAQLRWLERRGFNAVTLQAAWNHWVRGTKLPPRPVVLTFDDGYRSTFTRAYPAMRSVRWPGVVNLAVKNMDVAWGLSPRRLRRLIAADWEIDAHSLTHPDLTSLDAAQLHREVAGSRAQIRRRFGIPVNFFCYPAGDYNASVVAEVRQAGYLGATTIRSGLGRPSEMYTLRRVRVSRSDGVEGLAGRLHQLGALAP